jgi:hypothetical protein
MMHRHVGLVFNSGSEGNDMEKLIDIFCHAIRITDPLSIKIAVGIVGGGLPLIFLFAVFMMLSELVARQRDNSMLVSARADRGKKRTGRRSSVQK